MPANILNIALPVPVHKNFDYLSPHEASPGALAQVPFGRRTLIGVVISSLERARIPSAKLKTVKTILDERIPPDIVSLCQWTADYYHYPLGEVLHQALPPALRKPRKAQAPALGYELSAAGRGADGEDMRGTPAQAALLKWLSGRPSASTTQLRAAGFSAAVCRKLLERGFVTSHELQRPQAAWETPATAPRRAAPKLNATQNAALEDLSSALDRGFQTFVLHGVTGSGKTEIYLRLVEQALALGKQALVLTPEILLIPQLAEYFNARLETRPALLHSGASAGERLRAWKAAASGAARVVIGTRSAIFAPLPELGVIVVDEEHDPSFKQSEGLNYSARDLAVVRAKARRIPVALGSATPSLESLRNVAAKRYRLLKLPERIAGGAPMSMELIDIRAMELRGGLSPPLLKALLKTLQADEQALLFLNRRGFAPTWLCHRCGWIASCPNCDAKLVFHRQPEMLRCHHCAHRAPPQHVCPRCERHTMQAGGFGTQRIEAALGELPIQAPVHRIDRDSVLDNEEFLKLRAKINRGGAAILLGTQMLAKGHHFPGVTLVAVVDADSGLFSPDFRAGERLGQLLLQVAGRGGRGGGGGKMLVQTRHPEHPVFEALRARDYECFGRLLLDQRKRRQLPPFRRLAALRVQAKNGIDAERWLENFKRRLGANQTPSLDMIGPLPAALSKRQGWHQRMLLFYLREETDKRSLIDQLRQCANDKRKTLRWWLDVDPQEL